jgi:hypothetical protein
MIIYMDILRHVLATFISHENNQGGTHKIRIITTSWAFIHLCGDDEYVQGVVAELDVYQLYELFALYCILAFPRATETNHWAATMKIKIAAVERAFQLWWPAHISDDSAAQTMNELEPSSV